jgi:hypothetical protein
MSDPIRDQLLGYLLGALEDDEQEVLEQRLATDARLRRELALISKALAPLDATRRQYAPPSNLASDTCRFVASHVEDTVRLPRPRAAAPVAVMHPVDPPRSWRDSWRMQDLLMVAAVLLVANLLIFPAIHGSRVQARLLACQDNLRQLGAALTGYSERNQGFFPEVPTRGKLAVASVFGPILAQNQCLPDPRVVVCPGSSLAEEPRFAIPDLAQVEAAESDEQLSRLQESMGGSYGYTLGYEENGEYHPTRNLHRANFALAADAPGRWAPGHQSENHGRYGQNVLFEDGHVRFLVSPRPNDRSDDYFLNDDGYLAAGRHRNDSAIGAGATPPIRFVRGN